MATDSDLASLFDSIVGRQTQQTDPNAPPPQQAPVQADPSQQGPAPANLLPAQYLMQGGQRPDAGVTPNQPTGVSPTYTPDGKHTGIAGVAHDVLGTLGDFLLNHLGLPAMYAPAQQLRKEQEARQGFDDGSDQLGSINRMARVNAPMAQAMSTQMVDNNRTAAYQQSVEEARQTRLGFAQDKINTGRRSGLGGMLYSISKMPADQQQAAYTQQLPKLNAAAASMGDDPFSPTYDKNAAAAYVGQYTPLTVQQQIDAANGRNAATNVVTTAGQVSKATTAAAGQAVSVGNNERTTNQSNTNNIRTTDTSAAGHAITADTAAQHDTTVRRGQDMKSAGGSLANLKSKYGLK